MKKNNVLNINPTLRNSKYSFLFPFSIDIMFEPYCANKASSVEERAF